MIRQEGGKFVLYSKDGSRVLGRFDTRTAAEARERQILFFSRRGNRRNRRSRRAAAARLVVAAIICLVASGCLGGLRRSEILKHPDAPMYIAEARGRYVRVFVYVKADAKLVEYGWIRIADVEGWTLTKYDWEARAERDR